MCKHPVNLDAKDLQIRSRATHTYGAARLSLRPRGAVRQAPPSKEARPRLPTARSACPRSRRPASNARGSHPADPSTAVDALCRVASEHAHAPSAMPAQTTPPAASTRPTSAASESPVRALPSYAPRSERLPPLLPSLLTPSLALRWPNIGAGRSTGGHVTQSSASTLRRAYSRQSRSPSFTVCSSGITATSPTCPDWPSRARPAASPPPPGRTRAVRPVRPAC